MKKIFTLILATAACFNLYSQTLDDAQKALEGEQYEKARAILETLVKTDSLAGENYFHLGSLYLTLGEDELAINTFNQGIKQKKGGNLNYIGLGQYFLDEEQPDSASKYFGKALEKTRKKDTKELMYVARAYTKSYKPDYTKAAEYAKQAIAKNSKLAQAYLILGDAEFNLGNASEAFSAYRYAYDYDNELLRAKLHLAVITKNARAFDEAVNALNELTVSNPEYGPTYRELAETYYLWSLMDNSHRKDYITKALGYYKQYLTLTDQSLNSRMRHADFLILAKDYEALEKEAQEMQKLDKVNPRILRYLGYSAFENGNYTDAIKALNDFIAQVEPKRVVGLDYAYLARAQKKFAVTDEGVIIDSVEFVQMLDNISKAIAKEATLDNEFSELGIKFFKAKQYQNAYELFGTLIENPKSSLLEKLYYSNSVFYDVANRDSAEQVALLPVMVRADSVYGQVTVGAPSTQDAYFNRARLNRCMGETYEPNSIKYFQDYINIVSGKEAELAKERVREKISEAYTYIGTFYVESDQAMAIENFEKAVEFNPTNEHALQSLKFLKHTK